MTNRAAIIILLVVGLLAAVDVWLDLGVAVFLGRKLLALLDVIAVWR